MGWKRPALVGCPSNNQSRVMTPDEVSQRRQNPNPHRKRGGRTERFYAKDISNQSSQERLTKPEAELTSGHRLAKVVESYKAVNIKTRQKCLAKMTMVERLPKELGHKQFANIAVLGSWNRTRQSTFGNKGLAASIRCGRPKPQCLRETERTRRP